MTLPYIKAEYPVWFLGMLNDIDAYRIAAAADIVCSVSEGISSRWLVVQNHPCFSKVSDVSLMMEELKWHLLQRKHDSNPRDWRTFGAVTWEDLYLRRDLAMLCHNIMEERDARRMRVLKRRYRERNAELMEEYEVMRLYESECIEHEEALTLQYLSHFQYYC